MQFDKKKLIAFVDVGSFFIKVMIASISKDGNPISVSKSKVRSAGFLSGKITDFSLLSKSVNHALEEAEKNISCNVTDVVVSASGLNLKSYFLSSEIKFFIEKDIKEKEILDCASNIDIKNNIDLKKEEIIHIIPIKYIVDGKNVLNLDGVYGNNLQIFYHIITVNKSLFDEISSLFSLLNLNVKSFVSSSYASSLSTLVDDDRDVGSVLLDIGDKSVSISAFIDGQMAYVSSFPFGIDFISSAISKKINIKSLEVKKALFKYGVGAPLAMDFSEYINLNMIGENGVDEKTDILKSDFLQLSYDLACFFSENLKKYLSSEKIFSSVNRIIISGGGANIIGLKDILSSVFEKNIRIAKPFLKEGVSDNLNESEYSVIIGMFLFYYNKSYGMISYKEKEENKNWINKIKKFLEEKFV